MCARIHSGVLLAAALAASATAQSRIFHLPGGAPGEQFGYAVAAAGDVDRDGFPDVIAGAHLAGPNGLWSGTARVHSGRTGAVLWQFDGDAPGDRFGAAVAGAGDVDNDGTPDLIVGAPYADAPGRMDAGSVRVHSGRTGARLFTVSGFAPFEQFGYSVAGAGDVDRDGFADVIVGAPGSDANGQDSGRAYVISGRTQAVLWQLTGDGPFHALGTAVDGAGDVDGDGWPDVVVGAPQFFTGRRGQVRVHSGRTGSALISLTGTNFGDLLGFSVAGGGDANGDGTPDVLAGKVEAADFFQIGGAVRVISGRDGSTLQNVGGDGPFQSFGQSCAWVGDLDGDGRSDFIGGSGSNYAKVFSGATGVLLARMQGTADNSFGFAVAGVGDANGDGRPDVAVGAWRNDAGSTNPTGSVHLYSVGSLAFTTNVHTLSLAAGGQQNMTLSAAAQAGRTYLVLGSLTGTRPGTQLGPVTVPLNADGWMMFTLTNANTVPLLNTFASLDGSGAGAAGFLLPAGLPAVLAGLTFFHAFVTVDPATGQPAFASNSVSLLLQS